jgi:hypothetical protein
MKDDIRGMRVLIILLGVNHFGRVDESPDDIFEPAPPVVVQASGGWIAVPGGFDFLSTNLVCYGIEMVVPTDVAGRSGFISGFILGFGKLKEFEAGLEAGLDLSDVKLAFGRSGIPGEESKEDLVEKLTGRLILKRESIEGVVVAETRQPDAHGAIGNNGGLQCGWFAWTFVDDGLPYRIPAES